jgi:uncharacterized membrane-anchored protein
MRVWIASRAHPIGVIIEIILHVLAVFFLFAEVADMKISRVVRPKWWGAVISGVAIVHVWIVIRFEIGSLGLLRDKVLIIGIEVPRIDIGVTFVIVRRVGFKIFWVKLAHSKLPAIAL